MLSINILRASGNRTSRISDNLRCQCLRVTYIPVNCPACVLFAPLEKLLLTRKNGWNKTETRKFCTVSPQVTLNKFFKGAEMMRMNGLSRRETGWISCLAALVMTAVISFQPIPPGVSAAPAPKVEVKIDNFNFSPALLKVKAGTQITWTNGDDIPHTVVSESRAFKSKVLATGEKFTFVADKAGTYSYSCSIHPNMTGKVVVE
jgi:plastocyanin